MYQRARTDTPPQTQTLGETLRQWRRIHSHGLATRGTRRLFNAPSPSWTARVGPPTRHDGPSTRPIQQRFAIAPVRAPPTQDPDSLATRCSGGARHTRPPPLRLLLWCTGRQLVGDRRTRSSSPLTRDALAACVGPRPSRRRHRVLFQTADSALTLSPPPLSTHRTPFPPHPLLSFLLHATVGRWGDDGYTSQRIPSGRLSCSEARKRSWGVARGGGAGGWRAVRGVGDGAPPRPLLFLCFVPATAAQQVLCRRQPQSAAHRYCAPRHN